MRIDKLFSEMNLASRKDFKNLIKQKRVTVNGKVVTDAGFMVNESADTITLDGNNVVYEKYVYYMLNKPDGVVSATTDSDSQTVIDLLSSEGKKDLFPVGRLDKDTVGLLIITNDGDLGHKLTSPKHHAVKTYYARLRDELSEENRLLLESGVELKGDGITMPAKVQLITSREIKLSITEGKYHQVKRMLAAVGNEVVYLKRISMGGVFLDNSLQEGQYRRLTNEEILLLKEY